MRRTATALASLLVLVLLAGCVGGGLPAGSSSGSGGSTDAAGAATSGGQWERFAFSAGEYYRYRATDYATGDSAVITLEIASVDGSEVTADVTYDDGTTVVTRTATGMPSMLPLQLSSPDDDQATADAMHQTRTVLLAGPFNPMLTGYFANRELVVGDSWNAAGSAEIGYATANVEGRDTYADQDCYVTSYRVPDNGEWPAGAQEYEFCIAPDASLPFATIIYADATDEATVEIVLEEYRDA